MNVFFKIIDNKLYVTTDGMLEAGYKANSLASLCSQGVKTLPFIKDPHNLSRTLFDYEFLGKKYKAGILARWPKPYEEMVMQPIRSLLKKDLNAEKYYLAYRIADDKMKILPIAHVRKYTRACEVLNMLLEIGDNKKAIKQLTKISILDFWTKIGELIAADRIYLPQSYKRLREKVKLYKETGYECMIDGKLDNSNGLKIKDEVAESALLTLIEKPHVDDVMIARAYNTWAKQNGRKTISEGLVGNYRREKDPELLNGKKGAKAWFDKYGKVIKRKRASCPLACWEHDDNDLDLYYIKDKVNKKGNTEVFYYGRYVVAVVMDTYNDYIVGWAMAEVYTKDLIRIAYLDALYHIHDLTGGWYLPHQIRSDRFGLDVKLTNDLAQFYKSIATYTPAKAKSARGKYIEQSFGKKWHQVLCLYKNYAGHNIQSKAGINKELIETNKRVFPHESEAPFEIAGFINKTRNLQMVEDGPSRQEAWLEAFQASEISKQRQIDEQQMLLTFGTMHTFHNQIGDNKVQITSRGIEVTINKQLHEFDIDDDIYMQVVGKRVHVIYDPYNFSRVLITDGDKLRFIANKLTEEMKMPSALIDYQPGDRERLNKKLNAMKDHVKMFTDAKEKRQNILALNRIDIDGLLQSGLLIKGQKQAAELAYQNNLLGAGNVLEDALNGM